MWFNLKPKNIQEVNKTQYKIKYIDNLKGLNVIRLKRLYESDIEYVEEILGLLKSALASFDKDSN